MACEPTGGRGRLESGATPPALGVGTSARRHHHQEHQLAGGRDRLESGSTIDFVGDRDLDAPPYGG
jgi:hypothetical protein